MLEGARNGSMGGGAHLASTLDWKLPDPSLLFPARGDAEIVPILFLKFFEIHGTMFDEAPWWRGRRGWHGGDGAGGTRELQLNPYRGAMRRRRRPEARRGPTIFFFGLPVTH